MSNEKARKSICQLLIQDTQFTDQNSQIQFFSFQFVKTRRSFEGIIVWGFEGLEDVILVGIMDVSNPLLFCCRYCFVAVIVLLPLLFVTVIVLLPLLFCCRYCFDTQLCDICDVAIPHSWTSWNPAGRVEIPPGRVEIPHTGQKGHL